MTMDKPTALIVEDDRDIVALFRHVLDIAGYQTEIVLDGRDAMDRLDTMTPNIVLLDLQLPRVSGVDILKRMRSEERLLRVPVVVITAYAPIADSLPVEPDLLLLKPVDINQLSSLVQRLQSTHGAMHEPSHDKATGLYTHAFFMVRLAFSLERIKQSFFRRFGVLFVDLPQLKEVPPEELNSFLRRLADQFQVALRPTDTMAWSDQQAIFLTLIEEIPSPSTPLKISGRVRDAMRQYLDAQSITADRSVNLGVLLCDAEYNDIQEIMKDIAIAREGLRSGAFPNPTIFERAMLDPHR